MNYKSQLRGWAVDRAIETIKLLDERAQIAILEDEGLFAMADKLADYAYQAEEDFTDASKVMVSLAQSGEISIEQIDGLLQALEVVREQRVAFDKKGEAA